jgi:transposase
MKKSLEVVHPHAAGIDIGSRSFYLDAGEENIRVFPTFTEDCHALRAYLQSCGVTTVAMKSTGVYWVGSLQHSGGSWHRCLSGQWHRC